MMENNRERNDELDLVELFRGLWREKLLIVVIVTIVTLASVAYALLATPIYQARIFIQPPTQKDIAYLNYGRGGDTGLALLSVKDVYDVYLSSLQSESLRREFFQSVYLPTLTEEDRSGSLDGLYRRFSNLLVVAAVGKNAPDRYSITAELPAPTEAAKWVRTYAEMAGHIAKQEVLGNIRSQAAVKASNLQLQIDSAQKSAREQREDEIIKLKEALSVAKAVGLETSSIMFGNIANEVSSGMAGSFTYLHGSKALAAEIENLQSRQSDAPFITDIRKQQAALSFYRSLNIDPAIVSTYRQDGVIESPDQPFKPNKPSIVLFGLILGFILGLGGALTKFLWRSAMRPQ